MNENPNIDTFSYVCNGKIREGIAFLTKPGAYPVTDNTQYSADTSLSSAGRVRCTETSAVIYVADILPLPGIIRAGLRCCA